jgi:hypothetical protein
MQTCRKSPSLVDSLDEPSWILYCKRWRLKDSSACKKCRRPHPYHLETFRLRIHQAAKPRRLACENRAEHFLLLLPRLTTDLIILHPNAHVVTTVQVTVLRLHRHLKRYCQRFQLTTTELQPWWNLYANWTYLRQICRRMVSGRSLHPIGNVDLDPSRFHLRQNVGHPRRLVYSQCRSREMASLPKRRLRKATAGRTRITS